MYRLHTYCRACGYAQPTGPSGIKAAESADHLEPVFSLGIQPLANDFAKEGEPRAGHAPLDVLLCPQCDLAQLSVVVDPKILYSNYRYVTSPSRTMLAHFETLWGDLTAGREVHSVIEIGSNDGALLDWIANRAKVDVVGIEPAKNLAAQSEAKGIHTLNLFFNAASVDVVRNRWGLAGPDLVIARHVLCHCDDWKDFFQGIAALCGPKTTVAIETPHVQNLLDNCEFDTIYHEHLSYLTIKSVLAALNPTGLQLSRVIRYPIHGGAVLLVIERQGAPVHASVEGSFELERAGKDAWLGLTMRATRLVHELATLVRQLRGEGKTVAGLGASAKSTVWVNAAHFTKADIAFIADTTREKWGATSPGSDIPIVDEGALVRELPDYVVCFAWNFKGEVLDKFASLRKAGTKFIFPIPQVEIE